MKVEQVDYTSSRPAVPSGATCSTTRKVMVAQIAQRVGKPIKLQWLREEGIKHGRTRPVSIHHVKATVSGGDVVSYEHRMACRRWTSVTASATWSRHITRVQQRRCLPVLLGSQQPRRCSTRRPDGHQR